MTLRRNEHGYIGTETPPDRYTGQRLVVGANVTDPSARPMLEVVGRRGAILGVVMTGAQELLALGHDLTAMAQELLGAADGGPVAPAACLSPAVTLDELAAAWFAVRDPGGHHRHPEADREHCEEWRDLERIHAALVARAG